MKRAMTIGLVSLLSLVSSQLNASDQPVVIRDVDDRHPVVEAKMGEVIELGSADCCSRCQCRCCCKKIIRVMPEVKKSVKVSWACECEDVATVMPSSALRLTIPNLFKWRFASGSAEDKHSCAVNEMECTEPPCPGRIRTVKRLVKKESVVESIVYKTVVEYCCHGCGSVLENR